MNKFAFLPYKKYTFLKHLLESIEYLVDVCEFVYETWLLLCFNGKYSLFIKAMTCPQPEVVDNGTQSSTGVSPGDSVTYACDAYYRRVEGDMYRVCQTDETWNGTVPTCSMYNVLL